MPTADCRSHPQAPATITALPRRRDQDSRSLRRRWFQGSLRVIRRVGLAEDVDGIAGLEDASGKGRIGVEREIENREHADGVENQGCYTLHRGAFSLQERKTPL